MMSIFKPAILLLVALTGAITWSARVLADDLDRRCHATTSNG